MPATGLSIEAPETEGKEVPWTEQEEWKGRAPASLELRLRIEAQMRDILEMIGRAAGTQRYDAFEKQLIVEVFRLGRLLLALFLCLSESRLAFSRAGQEGVEARGSKKINKGRLLGTFFGKVRYWRRYEYRAQEGRGRFPLDEELGLLADGFSLGLLGRAVQLVTKMSYESAAVVMSSFLGWAPSSSTLKEAALGLGRYTAAWFEHCPAPADDGEVLVAQFDSKATPTATEEELSKRRGKRPANPYPHSARHRGRLRRESWSPRPRRKKGDKSKNGKMATLVVMYTLRKAQGPQGESVLLGPINRFVYASYAPKRHAVAIARREANKRGFTPLSGKKVQVVTDGDEDLALYIEELFPEAEHTLDVIHASEYLWTAAGCLFREGSKELKDWSERQQERLYDGLVHETILEGDKLLPKIEEPAKQERFAQCLEYLAKRVDTMDYASLRRQDLEIGSGAVEGAVRYVISQRFDEGGMRWIRERSEALLQLRCIEINGHWEQFIDFVSRRIAEQTAQTESSVRLLQSQPQPLPNYGLHSKN